MDRISRRSLLVATTLTPLAAGRICVGSEPESVLEKPQVVGVHPYLPGVQTDVLLADLRASIGEFLKRIPPPRDRLETNSRNVLQSCHSEDGYIQVDGIKYADPFICEWLERSPESLPESGRWRREVLPGSDDFGSSSLVEKGYYRGLKAVAFYAYGNCWAFRSIQHFHLIDAQLQLEGLKVCTSYLP